MRYDLNLLRAFDALYKQQSVSRAATQLGLTQPATSVLLSKLRELFNDPLFIRERYGIAPTDKSHQLYPEIADTLNRLDGIVFSQQVFDPHAATDTFDIAVNDYFEYLILPRLLHNLVEQAPQVTLNIVPMVQDVTLSGVMSGKSQLAFGRLNNLADNLVIKTVLQETLACLVSERLDVEHNRLTLAQYEGLQHIIVRPTHRLKTGVFQQLQNHNIQRKAKCSVTHFQFVPRLIQGSNYIATLPKRICQQFAMEQGLKMVAPPVDLGAFPFHLAWHGRYQNDPAHTWFRTLLQQSISEVQSGAD